MVNFNTTSAVGDVEKNLALAATSLVALINAVDNTKVIRDIGIKTKSDGQYFQAYIVHDV